MRSFIQISEFFINYLYFDNSSNRNSFQTKFLLQITNKFLFFGFFFFNGISTFVGYLMPKPFSKKNSSGTI